MSLVILIIICVCVGMYIKAKKNKNINNGVEDYYNNTYENIPNDNVNINNQDINNHNMTNQFVNNQNLFNGGNGSYYIENNRIHASIERLTDMSRQARIRNARTGQVLTLRKEFLSWDLAVHDEYDHIGYLGRDLSEILIQRMDRGEEFECVVKSVSGDGLNNLELNVLIYNKEDSQFNNIEDNFINNPIAHDSNYHSEPVENSEVQEEYSDDNNNVDDGSYESNEDESSDDNYEENGEDGSYDEENDSVDAENKEEKYEENNYEYSSNDDSNNN